MVTPNFLFGYQDPLALAKFCFLRIVLNYTKINIPVLVGTCTYRKPNYHEMHLTYVTKVHEGSVLKVMFLVLVLCQSKSRNYGLYSCVVYNSRAMMYMKAGGVKKYLQTG